MEPFIMIELSALGWSSLFEEQWRILSLPGLVPARVAAEHRGAYEAWSAASRGSARIAGRLRNEPGETGLPAVGDWVALDAPPGAGRIAVIERVLERSTVVLRGAAGRGTRAQVVAANVDLVLVVCGLDPDFNPRRIERYLARIRASGAKAAVILNKTDLCEDAAARVAEVSGRWPGVQVIPVSAIRGIGLDAIRESLAPGSTAALVGSSGAGKSTIVNALLGEERMVTRETRGSDGRGRHATTHRQLVALPGGGLLLDTPGMRELQLLDDDGLERVFEDVASLARRCRFADCTHGPEPDCAVKDAIAASRLGPGRLEHYRKLEREARAFERRHDERLRRENERAWGKRSREAEARGRWKRGG
jgi:ribosome biogenesis GTPase / thiamine phosphate phosphatase